MCVVVQVQLCADCEGNSSSCWPFVYLAAQVFTDLAITEIWLCVCSDSLSMLLLCAECSPISGYFWLIRALIFEATSSSLHLMLICPLLFAWSSWLYLQNFCIFPLVLLGVRRANWSVQSPFCSSYFFSVFLYSHVNAHCIGTSYISLILSWLCSRGCLVMNTSYGVIHGTS